MESAPETASIDQNPAPDGEKRASRYRFSLRTAFVLLTLLPLIVAQIQSARELAELRKEVARLREETGHFEIKDPNKVYILALRSQEEKHYRWRIYLPPNIAWKKTMAMGQIAATGFSNHGSSVSSSSSTGSAIGESQMMEVMVRRNINGELQLKFVTGNGSSSQNIDNKDLRWLDPMQSCPVSTKQAGAGGVQEFSPDQPIELLRMRVLPINEDGTTGPVPEKTDGILIYITHPDVKNE
ncbi:MAG: hypothetical protein U0894_18050 [Pirellulales bacterium]